MGRHRLTYRKKSSKPYCRTSTPATRILEQWHKLATFQQYPAQYDDDGKRPSWIQNLKAGDRVLVRGVNLKKYGKKEYEDCDLWVLEITGFALDATPDHKIWIKGNWFYSARHVQELDELFDISPFGKYELFASNHTDCVLPGHLHALTEVHEYLETSVDQEPIESKEFFTRCHYDASAGRLDRQYRLYECGSRDCHRSYNPDDKETVFHFCPRPSCRSWYDTVCLDSRRLFAEDQRPEAHAAALLCSHPDEDKSFVLPNLSASRSSASIIASLAQIRRGKTSEISAASSHNNRAISLASLPLPLLRLAGSQIIKGTKLYGIIGNVAEVVEARRLVYRCLTTTTRNSQQELKDWKERRGIRDNNSTSGVDVLRVSGSDTKTRPYICPKCKRAI